MVTRTSQLVSEVEDELNTMHSRRVRQYNDAELLLQRLYTILQSQPGTITMLERQVMNFHKVMNRSTREHHSENYKSYAYASVGDYFTVKFGLYGDALAAVPEINLDSITYIKDDSKLTCSFDTMKMKIKSSPSTRNYQYYRTGFSFVDRFLGQHGLPKLGSEEEVRMEVQDLLFDYTNLQEMFEEDE